MTDRLSGNTGGYSKPADKIIKVPIPGTFDPSMVVVYGTIRAYELQIRLSVTQCVLEDTRRVK